MAQLVEQLIRNQQVVGSSPTISSTKSAFCSQKALFYFVFSNTSSVWNENPSKSGLSQTAKTYFM